VALHCLRVALHCLRVAHEIPVVLRRPLSASHWCARRFEYDGQLNPHFSPGQFSLPVASIRAVLPEPMAPRLVHVSSAGACAALASVCMRHRGWRMATYVPVSLQNFIMSCPVPCRQFRHMADPHLGLGLGSDVWCVLPSTELVAACAGVTRPNRPGIDVDAEPPAVRMNDMLGGILTYKLEVGIKFLAVDFTSQWIPVEVLIK